MNTGNKGYFNAGDHNTGNCNAGDSNGGNYNAGSRNAGDRNSGNNNTGNYNAGCYNSGSHNAGSHNAGNYNSGRYNSGHYNSGRYNSGFGPISHFCSFSVVNRPVYLFNKLAPPNTPSKLPNIIRLSLGVKGDSRVVPYKEAWAKAWDKANKETKDDILGLPNFDQEIFQDITGISVEQKQQPVPDEVMINGKRYKLIEII